MVGRQREGDDRLPTQTCSPLCRSNQLVFRWSPALVHLAAGYFVGWRIHKAKLADGQVIVRVANRRAKGSALDGSERVEIAGSGVGIEHGAGLIVGKFGERLFVLRLGKEKAGGWIAWKLRTEACTRIRSTAADSLGDAGVSRSQAFAQLFRIKL